MPLVINKDTGLAENVQTVDPMLHEVPLYNSDGTFGTAEMADAPDLLANGYTQPNPEQLKQLHKEGKYGTTEQQVKTGLEGLAQGVLGPLAPAAERAMGVAPEDIRGREEVNPTVAGVSEAVGLTGSMFTGTGQGALLLKAGDKAAKLVAKAGVKSLIAKGAARGAVEQALFQTSDELAKLINEDPEQSVETALSAVGMASLFGGAGGAAFGAADAAWKALIGGKATAYVRGLKNKASEVLGKAPDVEREVMDPFTKQMVMRKESSLVRNAANEGKDPFTKKTFKSKPSADEIEGAKAMESYIENKIQDYAKDTLGQTVLNAVGSTFGLPGYLISKYAGEPILKTIMPTITKTLVSNGVNGAGFKAAIDFGKAVIKGETMLNKAAKSVFDGATMELTLHKTNELSKMVDEAQKDPEKLMKVTENEVGHYLPGQGAALGATAARTVQYLASLKPNQDKMGVLDAPRTPPAQELADYHRALNIAQNPMSVMQKIQEGRIAPDDIKHLRAMYPQLHKRMQQKLTEQMIESITKKQQIPYKVKLALSAFMGQPLDATMQPTFIQSTQPVPQQPAPNSGMLPKKNTDKLSKGPEQFQTVNQAGEKRRTEAH